jgi:hypothetical protein
MHQNRTEETEIITHKEIGDRRTALVGEIAAEGGAMVR